MFMQIDGIGRIHVARTGPRGAPPLVLLHPVSMDLSWWGDQFAAFGEDYDVIAIDLPGHGLSDLPTAAPSFDAMADAVERMLAQMDIGAAHLVGVSVGGMIAQTLALRRPGVVQSLTLVATLCTFPDAVRQALRERARIARTDGMEQIVPLSIARWFTPAFQARRPDVAARAALGLLRQTGEFHARMWDMIAQLDVERALHGIACPTLVITGTEDVNAPPAAAQQIAAAIPGAVVTLMPGLGHFPPFEDPQEFNRILRAFLAQQGATVGQHRS